MSLKLIDELSIAVIRDQMFSEIKDSFAELEIADPAYEITERVAMREHIIRKQINYAALRLSEEELRGTKSWYIKKTREALKQSTLPKIAEKIKDINLFRHPRISGRIYLRVLFTEDLYKEDPNSEQDVKDEAIKIIKAYFIRQDVPVFGDDLEYEYATYKRHKVEGTVFYLNGGSERIKPEIIAETLKPHQLIGRDLTLTLITSVLFNYFTQRSGEVLNIVLDDPSSDVEIYGNEAFAILKTKEEADDGS